MGFESDTKAIGPVDRLGTDALGVELGALTRQFDGGRFNL
jgi:hypothetical protein